MPHASAHITIVGLGPAGADLLTVGALEALGTTRTVILRTGRHPAADDLAGLGVRFSTCDDLYETHDSFEAVYAAIVRRVREAAAEGPVVYAVPGDPWVAERTVRMLLETEPGARVLPALGALNLILDRLRLDPGDGLIVADARDPLLRPAIEAPAPEEHEGYHGLATPIVPRTPTIWFQVDTPMVAGHLKLMLLEQYPADHPVTVLTALGTEDEDVDTVPLSELDRGPAITHLTSLYVPPLAWPQRRHTVRDLVALMALLRSDRGCPWDREQDARSIRRTVIEEAYEVVEAIDRDDPAAQAEELGDLLLNILFLAQLGAEEGVFDFDEVVDTLAAKLIRRHAHVFGAVEADTARAALRSWEAVKDVEREAKGETSIFDDVPAAFPALSRAQKVQKRAARVGFDWADFRGPLAKLHEEVEELSQEVGVPETWERPPALRETYTRDEAAQRRADEAPRARVVHEVGDILFAAVNLCRFLHVDAEETLRDATSRFIRRFARMEAAMHADGTRLADLTLEEMDAYWMANKGDD